MRRLSQWPEESGAAGGEPNSAVSGREVAAFIEVGDQPGVLGLPPEQLLGQGAGGRAVEQGEGGHPGKVALRFLAGDGGTPQTFPLALLPLSVKLAPGFRRSRQRRGLG